MKTTVVNIKTDEFDVLIDRTTKWGNPFEIGPKMTREQAIAAFRVNLKRRPDLLADLHELRGKRLGCHCKPLACHGDVLVELIEQQCR